MQGCLLAAFGGKMVDPLVVKDSFLRGSPIFSQQVAKRPPGWVSTLDGSHL